MCLFHESAAAQQHVSQLCCAVRVSGPARHQERNKHDQHCQLHWTLNYRVSHDTGHLENLAKSQALYEHELDT